MRIRQLTKFIVRQSSKMPELPGDTSYQNAVATLNTLQSPLSVRAALKKAKCIDPAFNVIETAKCLHRIGVEVDSLNSLRVVHITGTKGKGSTAAIVEACLRAKGFRTGFFSSPHLVHVRERIRLNGEPISENVFTQHFWKVYSALHANHDAVTAPMPSYFKFLTVMAYAVFLRENVDVAIVEVGIGGESDCTNVIRSPWVTAITTLDLDHTAMLGDCLESIAHHKAGIFKRGAVALSAANQEESPLKVMSARASSIGERLRIAPSSLCNFSPTSLTLGIEGEHQQLNASLALCIVRHWLARHSGVTVDNLEATEENDNIHNETTFHPDEQVCPFILMVSIAQLVNALQTCRWPGRSDVRWMSDNLVYYLDGAHTPKSIHAASQWFKGAECKNATSTNDKQVLVFYCARERDARPMLKELMNEHTFSAVLMTPLTVAGVQSVDNRNVAVTESSQQTVCDAHAQEYREMGGKNCYVMPSTVSAVEYAKQLSIDGGSRVHVFVTGSLHLVGAVLSAQSEGN